MIIYSSFFQNTCRSSVPKPYLFNTSTSTCKLVGCAQVKRGISSCNFSTLDQVCINYLLKQLWQLQNQEKWFYGFTFALIPRFCLQLNFDTVCVEFPNVFLNDSWVCSLDLTWNLAMGWELRIPPIGFDLNFDLFCIFIYFGSPVKPKRGEIFRAKYPCLLKHYCLPVSRGWQLAKKGGGQSQSGFLHDEMAWLA